MENRTQLGLTWVAHEDVNKIYKIHTRILATAAGLRVTCCEFADAARDLYKAVFGDISASEGCYIVAQLLLSMMDKYGRGKTPQSYLQTF